MIFVAGYFLCATVGLGSTSGFSADLHADGTPQRCQVRLQELRQFADGRFYLFVNVMNASSEEDSGRNPSTLPSSWCSGSTESAGSRLTPGQEATAACTPIGP